MLSNYFKFKIKTKSFNTNLEKIIQDLKSLNILVCADKEEFKFLDKKYKLTSVLNISSIIFCDKKNNKKEKIFKNIKIIDFHQISDEKFDAILVSSENSEEVINKLNFVYSVNNVIVKSLFTETIKDGRQNLEYALKYGFERYFKSLNKKLKNKKVMIYGTGIFFKILYEYFDFSKINIIGVVDKKYKNINEDKEFLGYKTFKPENIVSENPDYLLVATKKFIPIFENLYFGYLDKTKIKIIPILKKNIFNLLSEMDN